MAKHYPRVLCESPFPPAHYIFRAAGTLRGLFKFFRVLPATLMRVGEFSQLFTFTATPIS